MELEKLWPPYAVSVTAGDLELRVVRESDAPELVGIQGLDATDFRITRTVETGSWLGLRHHGRGIGTRMRQAVCAFAFDELGAEEITSGAFLDNPQSLAVSRKVGYRADCVRRLAREGEVALNQRLVLTPGAFVRGEPITVAGAEGLRGFLGAATAGPETVTEDADATSRRASSTRTRVGTDPVRHRRRQPSSPPAGGTQ